MGLQATGVIKGFAEHHTTEDVSFEVTVSRKGMDGVFEEDGEGEPTGETYRRWKMETRVGETNMNAFGPDDSIVKYESPGEIIDAFFPVRLEMYGRRKEEIVRRAVHGARSLENRERFVEGVVGGEVEIMGGERTKEEIVVCLEGMGFDRKGVLDAILEGGGDGATEDTGDREGNEKDGEEPPQTVPDSTGYDYLLSTPVSSFTSTNIHALRTERTELERTLVVARGTTREEMWLEDLEKLEKALKGGGGGGGTHHPPPSN